MQSQNGLGCPMTSKDPTEYTQILYEEPAEKIARIVLNRPNKRNAQGTVMTYELDAAMQRACQDDKIHVISARAMISA
jgi:enoyl-CoA hydratase